MPEKDVSKLRREFRICFELDATRGGGGEETTVNRYRSVETNFRSIVFEQFDVFLNADRALWRSENS